eukprot:360029-Chlamydomonas_euryale.AAC.3
MGPACWSYGGSSRLTTAACPESRSATRRVPSTPSHTFHACHTSRTWMRPLPNVAAGPTTVARPLSRSAPLRISEALAELALTSTANGLCVSAGP